MKNFNILYFWGSLKFLIFRGEGSRKTNIEGGLSKKKGWGRGLDSLQI